MWSDSPGWRRGSGWMWVDGWNFVGMTDRQMAEWSGGSVCVGMTDGWMDGWMVEQIVAARWMEKREWMDGVRYLVDKMDKKAGEHALSCQHVADLL
jgi:hypothetical protein